VNDHTQKILVTVGKKVGKRDSKVHKGGSKQSDNEPSRRVRYMRKHGRNKKECNF
jgi:hypothetical protein